MLTVAVFAEHGGHPGSATNQRNSRLQLSCCISWSKPRLPTPGVSIRCAIEFDMAASVQGIFQQPVNALMAEKIVSGGVHNIIFR
jgi:hypothetical protein